MNTLVSLAALLLLTAAAPVGVASERFQAASSPTAPARRIQADHVAVELVADGSSAAAGVVDVGIRFLLEPEWHIYWQNPGDSGTPPGVTWRLPRGWEAGPIEWPTPERIPFPPLVNYGYSGDVVLPVSLRVPPAEVVPDAPVGAHVRWLVCRDICIAGRADLAVTLPVPSGSDRTAWRTIVDRARARVPRPAPPTWKASAVSDGDHFVVTVDTGTPEKQGTFFPIDVLQIDDSADQVVTPGRSGLTFRLKKSNQLLQLPPALKGVVALSSGRAFVVTAALVQG
jgi:thiol:disulfide interchange protein DsbD